MTQTLSFFCVKMGKQTQISEASPDLPKAHGEYIAEPGITPSVLSSLASESVCLFVCFLRFIYFILQEERE